MEADRSPGLALYERIVHVKPLPHDDEPQKPAESENKVHGDHGVMPSRRQELKTPLGVLDDWAKEQYAVFGEKIPEIEVTTSRRKWNNVAHLEIEPSELSEGGFELCFSVTGDPRYMAQPNDLIAIYLEPAVDDSRLTIAVIQPTWEYNHWTIRVRYSLEQLARVLRITTGSGQAPTPEMIIKACPEIGVRAKWFGIMSNSPGNLVRHDSGGLLQKGGSGKLRLRPYTEKELRETESRRNTAWNMGEKLGLLRPVFNNYKTILQVGKEMLTTLECESEYILPSERELDDVIIKMKKLCEDATGQQSLRIVKMTGEPKQYEDTYYDLPSPCALLAHRIVLRRRDRKGDEPGTFLFALKGRRSKGEQLRLAAQVQLRQAALATPEGKAELRDFLGRETVDNAFGRALLHALEGDQQAILRLAKEDIVPTLVIRSVRETFTMTLGDGTEIEFSADKATGTLVGSGGGSYTLYTFEFGLGHPALTQAATTSTTSTAKGGGSILQKAAQFGATTAQAQIVRPYHVPADLDNPAMLKGADYAEFVRLRDRVILEVFGFKPEGLKPGGTKAYDLAGLLGLIK